MSGKSMLLMALALLLCLALLSRLAATPAAHAETEPGSQIMPRESLPADDVPARSGEGPAGLPTPTVGESVT